jgi:flagellar biosynthesis protein FlhF
MRLKRISVAEDLAAFEAIAESEAEDVRSIAWPAAPKLLIADVLALHHAPAALAERMMTVIQLGQNRSVIGKPREGDPLHDLGEALAACLSFSSFAGLWRGGSLALVGPPGVGKTTLAGKLAARARRSRPILLNTDATRTGVTAQLAEYSGVLGIALQSAGDAEALARSLRGRSRRIIIDTSGINPYDRGAVGELARLVRSARAEPVLVLPANIEAEEAVEIVQAFGGMPIRRLLVTRLDIVRRLGGLLAAAEAGGYDIVGGSVTPHFTYGLRPLTPMVLARRLLSAALEDERWTTR